MPVLRYATLRLQVHDDPTRSWMVGAQMAKPLEMVGGDPAARLGFNRDIHLAHDEATSMPVARRQ
jgi:hypothetical protein